MRYFRSNILTSLVLIPNCISGFSSKLSFQLKSQYNQHLRMMSSNTDSECDVVSNLFYVKSKMNDAALRSQRDPATITLVAVSKTKPINEIQKLYDNGHRHFGENYFQELVDKASQLPSDISWHFIGHLQSQKAPKIIREVPNLAVIETVDSLKLATKLNNACVTNGKEKLNIYVQVHTSDEETKSGVSIEELTELVTAITNECPKLSIQGLMTIGAPNDLSCFDKLVACREDVAGVLNISSESLHLSMGMSGDFEEAIARGATSIRVGSTIFGPRIYTK
jgi:pyridoxal phosphate enzyme (YggS family)